MCTWCGQYWECDGEGGEPCRDDDPICGPRCVEGGWEIDCAVPLQYADGKPVLEQGTRKQVVVHVRGKGDGSASSQLEITLNRSNRVGPGIINGGTRPKYAHPHPRERKWQIDHPEPLKDEEGRPIIADPGGAVVLRVQAYGYKPDYINPPQPQTNHCSGKGPKIRLEMINPKPSSP